MENLSSAEVVRFRSKISLGKLLEDQWNNGTFQNVKLICKDKEEMSLNPMLLNLLFPFMLDKVNLELHDIILLPMHDKSSVKFSINQLLSLCPEEQEIKPSRSRSRSSIKMEPALSVPKNGEGYQSYNPENDPALFLDQTDEVYDENDNADDYEEVGEPPHQPTVIKEKKKIWKSVIWDFFTQVENNYVSCKECEAKLSAKNASSKSLVVHLKSKHPVLNSSYEELKRQQDSSKAEFLAQPQHTLRNTEKRSVAWKFFKPVSSEKACCLQCSAIISTKVGSTKGLITHIKAFHPAQYSEFLSNKKTGKDKSTEKRNTEVGKQELIQSPQCALCSDRFSDEEIIGCPFKKCHARFHYRCKPPLLSGLDGLEVCPICSAKENKKYRLCTECGKSVQNMSKHLNMHRGIKPDRLQCHICEKTLCSANALKVHVETIHEGIRRFSCKFCENSFIYSSHLKRHILVVHHNYKNPKAICPECDKQFKFISTMRRHRRVEHLGEVIQKKYFCSQCKQMFFKESLLSAHLREQHGILHPRKKTGKARDSLVDRRSILDEYPNLIKPEDLDFQT